MNTTDTDMIPGVTLGMELKVRSLGTVVLEELLGEQGGYGVVFRGSIKKNGAAVAVKFMREIEYASEEERQRDRDRFKREVNTLKWICKNCGLGGPPPFPAFRGSGELWEITPFYVMEWLQPVNLLSLDTNDKRYKYVWDVCFAVSALHDAGYVHYDIKPSNIMMRRQSEDGNVEYVLVDFGSVHRKEEGRRDCRSQSVSLLADGRRLFPHTPGYADPQETLHTVNADIYAIGQVIRDTFAKSVSPEWAEIIDKCTSRNREYRYPDVESIMKDLERLKEARYMLTSDEDRRIWLAQKAVSEEESCLEMSWDDLRMQLGLFTQPTLNEDEHPNGPNLKKPISELFIDFDRLGLKNRNIFITDPVHMAPFGLLVIRGNGRIFIDLDGNGQDCDGVRVNTAKWGEPIYPFVILLDGATLVNMTRLNNVDAQLMYMVGRYCLLNFSERRAASAEDPRYILTGRAGYSFVRNGWQTAERGLYGILSEGRSNLFKQQAWDELDIRKILQILRKIRPESRQGDVQDWLERNVESVLMRNLGRYDIQGWGKCK